MLLHNLGGPVLCGVRFFQYSPLYLVDDSAAECNFVQNAGDDRLLNTCDFLGERQYEGRCGSQSNILHGAIDDFLSRAPSSASGKDLVVGVGRLEV